MYKIKDEIAAACGFEAPCDIALIYQCDGENVADGGEPLYMLNITSIVTTTRPPFIKSCVTIWAIFINATNCPTA